MRQIALSVILALSSLRLPLHVALVVLSPQRRAIEADLERWSWVLRDRPCSSTGERLRFFVRVMTLHPEYRNLFYYRIGWVARPLRILCRPLSTLYLLTPEIGPGLFIQHGFATIVSAERIGANCWINQQVTVGFSNRTDRPTIGDDVTIYAGAKVIGSVRVGDGAVVGANAVVVHDVPSGATVGGVPARILCGADAGKRSGLTG